MSPDIEKKWSIPPLMATEKSVLLVANPASCSGKAQKRIDQARKLLTQFGLDHGYKSTLPDGKTVELVSQAITQQGYRIIISLGGDGTFGDVAKGICQSGLANEVLLGHLPAGTANDQGKSFGLSSAIKALEDNILFIAAGHTTKLDVGEVIGRQEDGTILYRSLFFDSIGWGLSAAILAFRNTEMEIIKKVPVVRDMYRDHLVYIRAAARELAQKWLTRDHFAAEITVNGSLVAFNELTDIVITNTPLYGGEWIVDSESKHDDGIFELATFQSIRDWTNKVFLNHKKIPMSQETANRLGIFFSPTFSGSEFQIRFTNPIKNKEIPAQMDGEELPSADHISISIYPRLLNVIVPEDFHWI
jgi:diacylglycerol kinase family enzyme